MRTTLAVLLLIGTFGSGCEGDEAGDACVPATITPHLSPAILPDMPLLLDNETADPGTPVATPYEWVLLLQSGCEETLEITEACIVADDHDGTGQPAFAIEGPVPAEVGFGQEAAVRITYDPATVNAADRDGDGNPDPDRVAIVVQSNATNFPTLIVPLCARAVHRDGAPLPAYECTSPVSLAPGAVDPTLCSR